MAYSKEIYEKALTEIKKRRADAEKAAEKRREELEEKCPDLKYINEKLGSGYVVPLIGVYKDVNDILAKNAMIRAFTRSVTTKREFHTVQSFAPVILTCLKA